MKKKDLAIIAGTLVYSFLFYHQNAGLNFLVFSVFCIGLFAWIDKDLLKNKMWLFTSALTALSGVFVLLYGSSLSITGNCICLFLLPAVSVNSRSSVIFNLFYSLYSVAGSIIFMIISFINASKQSKEAGKKEGVLKFATFLVPLVLILIFFFIYKSINPLFEKYTDVISGEWILFMIGGLFIIYGLIRHERIKELDAWENKQSENLDAKNFSAEKWNEKKAFMLLFITLNAMLIFINILDINYLYLGSGMPKGLTHKEFVHNGVGMLIFSIMLGIGVILYFFRGALNFEGNKLFKILVYAWLFQNLMMVLATAVRNKMYIDDALLTYKRIGVYYWLFLAALGLITTAIKIWKAKSNWYLVKSNSLIYYFILILSGGIDWDKYISHYNLENAETIASLDKRYLVSLSETNLRQLNDIKDHPDFNTDSVYHYGYYKYSQSNTSGLDYKLYHFLCDSTGDWRSFNFRKDRVANEISELYKRGKIDSLDFSDYYIKTLKPVYRFGNIKRLKLTSCHQFVFSEINHFPLLEKLSVTYIDDENIKHLVKLKNLKTICIYFSSSSSSYVNELIAKLKTAMPDIEIVGIKTDDR